MFQGQISKELYLRNVSLIDVKWKGSELIGYCADYMTLPFDHTHDPDLWVSSCGINTTAFDGYLLLHDGHLIGS